MKKISPLLLIVIIAMSNVKTLTAQSWGLTGNSGTLVNTNFVGTKDNKALVFRTNNIEQMRILNYGYVGIGTKNPLARLQVENGPFVNLSSPGCFQIGAATAINLGMDYSAIQARNNGAASRLYLNYFGGDIWIGAHNANPSPAIYVATDGRVGVSNSNVTPGYALTVNTTSALSGINVANPGINPAFNSIKSGDGNVIDVEKTSTTSGSATIYCSNSGGGWSIQAESNFGDGILGYSAQGYGMFAYANNNNGLFAYTDNNAAYYAGYFEGDVYSSTGVYAGSDQKLKQNIRDFTSATDIINQLQPKLYQFRHDGNYKLMNLPQGEHYGLIAQDVEKVLPNLVKNSKFETPRKPNTAEQKAIKAETIDFKALNYTELIPIIIKGMQEQQQQIQEQEQVNEQLQVQVTELKNIVQSLSQNKSLDFSPSATKTYLQQNIPNPFSADTKIQCTLPAYIKSAALIISNMDGTTIQSYSINTSGTNLITIHGSSLPAGQYTYSLVADGKVLGTKSMVLTR
jgi:hypothetical protein